MLVVIITAIITFLITSLLMYNYLAKGQISTSSTATSDSRKIASKLASYKKIIDEYYLGDVDESKLEEGAIKGYIEGLNDPYTEYISKDDMESYMDDTMGNFVGIGIYMIKNTETNKIQVLSTIKRKSSRKSRNSSRRLNYFC